MCPCDVPGARSEAYPGESQRPSLQQLGVELGASAYATEVRIDPSSLWNFKESKVKVPYSYI